MTKSNINIEHTPSSLHATMLINNKIEIYFSYASFMQILQNKKILRKGKK